MYASDIEDLVIQFPQVQNKFLGVFAINEVPVFYSQSFAVVNIDKAGRKYLLMCA
jgi:hypothetical protein